MNATHKEHTLTCLFSGLEKGFFVSEWTMTRADKIWMTSVKLDRQQAAGKILRLNWTICL